MAFYRYYFLSPINNIVDLTNFSVLNNSDHKTEIVRKKYRVSQYFYRQVRQNISSKNWRYSVRECESVWDCVSVRVYERVPESVRVCESMRECESELDSFRVTFWINILCCGNLILVSNGFSKVKAVGRWWRRNVNAKPCVKILNLFYMHEK